MFAHSLGCHVTLDALRLSSFKNERTVIDSVILMEPAVWSETIDTEQEGDSVYNWRGIFKKGFDNYNFYLSYNPFDGALKIMKPTSYDPLVHMVMIPEGMSRITKTGYTSGKTIYNHLDAVELISDMYDDFVIELEQKTSINELNVLLTELYEKVKYFKKGLYNSSFYTYYVDQLESEIRMVQSCESMSQVSPHIERIKEISESIYKSYASHTDKGFHDLHRQCWPSARTPEALAGFIRCNRHYTLGEGGNRYRFISSVNYLKTLIDEEWVFSDKLGHSYLLTRL